jgi:hypothetical protein
VLRYEADEGLVPNVEAASGPNLIDRTDPSPVPPWLVKTPAAGHPLPWGEGYDFRLVAAWPRCATWCRECREQCGGYRGTGNVEAGFSRADFVVFHGRSNAAALKAASARTG